MMGVYLITTPRGEYYVGSAVDISTRWSRHRSDLRKGRHCNQYMQRIYNKHPDGWEFEILEIITKIAVLRTRESYWIGVMGSELNISTNTDHPSKCPTVRARIADISRRVQSKPVYCVNTGEQWSSGKVAAKTQGLNLNSFNDALRRGNACGGLHYCRVGQTHQPSPSRGESSNVSAVKYIETGVVFMSIAKAARAYDLNAGTLSSSVQRGNSVWVAGRKLNFERAHHG